MLQQKTKKNGTFKRSSLGKEIRKTDGLTTEDDKL